VRKSTILAGFTVMALGAVSLATTAIADARKGPGGRGEGPDFSQLDVNKDGQITQSDIDASRQQRFAAADANGDDALSEDELIASAEARMQERLGQRTKAMIERRDANKDGVLSQDELTPRESGRMFKRMDKDGDGAITQAEFDAAKAARGERGKGKRGKGKRDHDNN